MSPHLPLEFISSAHSFSSVVNAAFWSWTVWWGLNDRGPRSPHRSKRCYNCRNGHAFIHCRRVSAGHGHAGGHVEGSIALGSIMRQPISPTRPKEALPASKVGKPPTIPENAARIGHTARQASFSSSNFGDERSGEMSFEKGGGDSPV